MIRKDPPPPGPGPPTGRSRRARWSLIISLLIVAAVLIGSAIYEGATGGGMSGLKPRACGSAGAPSCPPGNYQLIGARPADLREQGPTAAISVPTLAGTTQVDPQ